MTAIMIDLQTLLSLAAADAQEEATHKREAAKSGTDDKKRNPYMPAYCDPNNEFRGTKYDATRYLPLTEVCKLIRQDIRDAIAGGLLPKVKVSVRKEDARAVTLIVKEVPEAFQFYSPKYLKWAREYPFEDKHGCGRNYPGWSDPRSEQYRQVIDALTEIVQAYNRDNSDSMVDYFDVRFYTTVDFCRELTADRKEEEMAALPA
ncbi:hypothetical protein [Novispirillum itersonii]|uniref:Uncharacterized protein n=1 Tax=Novispirillum itersonii TaxID=189 RepID=A0A7X0DNZ3_NOVIT|nr:hypothetical protein [Novispirillum itersonii]MBB6212505.1 hypothetical protein [Novispirillum itersonii]